MLNTSIRFNTCQTKLDDCLLIKVTGADRESFFQGQVTNDLSKLSINEGHLTARLNRTGKIQSFFFIAKFSEYLLILCPKSLATKIKNDFEKFIIMEDVELHPMTGEPWVQFNYSLNNIDPIGPYFDFIYYGINARLVFEKHTELKLADDKELEEVRILNGWPKWTQDVDESYFINETYLNEIAISYNKGCFLGQETVAKIENNRGAAYYPVLLKLTSDQNLDQFKNQDFQINHQNGTIKGGKFLYQVKNLVQVLLFRDFRVVGRDICLLFDKQKVNGTVMDLPYYKNFSQKDTAQELYYNGTKAFQENNTSLALEFMEKALAFDAGLADAYESIGVILGRKEKFEEAIAWMNKLLIINPNSVMAHTNKSLYLMKLGKIEEAELEKSLATTKSFAMFGQEATEQRKKEEETIRREKMFLQVLEIDPEDTTALFGMASVFFERKDFKRTVENLKKVIELDAKYSSAYLLIGKAYEAEGNRDEAKLFYQNGIEIASKCGEMMPAKEMQSRLNQLIVCPHRE